MICLFMVRKRLLRYLMLIYRFFPIPACMFCSYANNAKLLNYLVSISVDGMSLMCVWCLFSSICFGIRQIEEETLFGSTGSSLFYALL